MQNKKTLTQLGFFFGFSMALILAIIFRINYLALGNLDNKSLKVLEGIILLISMICYIWHLLMQAQVHVSIIITQTILMLILILSGGCQEQDLWAGIHFSAYGISSLVWISHVLFRRGIPQAANSK